MENNKSSSLSEENLANYSLILKASEMNLILAIMMAYCPSKQVCESL